MFTMIMYILIWVFVRATKYHGSKQILRSITIVTVCGVGGWFISMTLFNVAAHFDLTLLEFQVSSLYIGIFLNTSVAINYPVYFVMR